MRTYLMMDGTQYEPPESCRLNISGCWSPHPEKPKILEIDGRCTLVWWPLIIAEINSRVCGWGWGEQILFPLITDFREHCEIDKLEVMFVGPACKLPNGAPGDMTMVVYAVIPNSPKQISVGITTTDPNVLPFPYYSDLLPREVEN